MIIFGILLSSSHRRELFSLVKIEFLLSKFFCKFANFLFFQLLQIQFLRVLKKSTHDIDI